MRLQNHKLVRRHVDNVKICLLNDNIPDAEDKFIFIGEPAPVAEQSNTPDTVELYHSTRGRPPNQYSLDDISSLGERRCYNL